ncbi:MAG: hypothetical protein HC876_20955 [Chloroflexaceae bacterium]|nr:hypothetical protein [Chloroflexaceae bacterium]
MSPGGFVACWGRNSLGQTSPPDVSFAQISLGRDFGCGIRTTDRKLQCWGNRFHGQGLGVEHPDNTAAPFQSVAAGDAHVCAITATTGTVFCWGWDEDGQVSLLPAGSHTMLSLGHDYSIARRTDTTLACWGATDVCTALP